MCDWVEKEYAEYLLWAEAEKARAFVKPARVEAKRSEPLTRARAPEPVLIEA